MPNRRSVGLITAPQSDPHTAGRGYRRNIGPAFGSDQGWRQPGATATRRHHWRECRRKNRPRLGANPGLETAAVGRYPVMEHEPGDTTLAKATKLDRVHAEVAQVLGQETSSC